MSIEDPRLSSIDNTSAADDFDSAVEQHLGFANEADVGIEVAQAETSEAGRTDRLPAQEPVQAVSAGIPTEVTPDERNFVTLPAGIELDNLEFEVDGENLVLILADGTEIVVLGGAANIPTFVIGDLELPQAALFAALEGSNINVAAGPDGTFTAQGAPDASRNLVDNQIDASPEDFALAALLEDTSFGDEQQTGAVLGADGDTRPTFSLLVTRTGGVDEDYLLDGNQNDGVNGGSSISGSLGINWGSDEANVLGNTGLDAQKDRGVGFTQETLDALASQVLTSDGVSLVYALSDNGTVLTAYKDIGAGGFGERVFVASVSDAENGSYTFQLIGNLDHQAGLSENNTTIQFPFTAQDSDGSKASSTFSIIVNDDSPVIGTPENESVNEDGLTGKSEAPLFAKAVSEGDSAEGSLAIRWGADNDLKRETLGENGQPNGDDPIGRTVSFTGLNTSSKTEEIAEAIPGLAGLSSDGFPLSYRIEHTVGDDGKWNGGYQLIAFKSFFDGPPQVALLMADERELGSDLPFPAEDETIFVITLDPTSTNGSYTFELKGNLDHYETGGNGSDKPEAGDFLDLEIPFTATDSDGDSVDGSFTVRIEDDEPMAVGSETGTVAENDLASFNPFYPLIFDFWQGSNGTSPYDGTSSDHSNTGLLGTVPVWGTLADNIVGGADDRGSFNLVTEAEAEEILKTLGPDDGYLTSKGNEINDARMITIEGVGDAMGFFASDGRLVFGLLVAENGTYNFRLFDQVDHPIGDNADTDAPEAVADTIAIDLSALVTFTDFDGDKIDLGKDLFVISITDDIPEVVGNLEVTLNEGDLSNFLSPVNLLLVALGAPVVGSNGNEQDPDGLLDGLFGTTSASGFLNRLFGDKVVAGGADEAGKFELVTEARAEALLAGAGWRSNGSPIIDARIVTIEGLGQAMGLFTQDGRMVISLALGNGPLGAYDIRVWDQLDHAAHDNPATGVVETAFEDSLLLNLGQFITYTDADGDKIDLDGDVTLKVVDDIPVVVGNLVLTLNEGDLSNFFAPINVLLLALGAPVVGSNGNEQNADGLLDQLFGTTSASGFLNELFGDKIVAAGADEIGRFGLVTEAQAEALLLAAGWSSKGSEITDARMITIEGIGQAMGLFTEDGRMVVSLTLGNGPLGAYDIRIWDQLDHRVGDDRTTAAPEAVEDTLALNLGQFITYTDADGDKIGLDGHVTLNVIDDIPEVVGTKTISLDEDDLSNFNSLWSLGFAQLLLTEGSNGTDRHPGGALDPQLGTTSQSGLLNSLIGNKLVSVGADEMGKFGLVSEARAEALLGSLNSKGQPVNDVRILQVPGLGSVLGFFSNDGRLVLTLAVSEAGVYDVRLFDQLDHEYGNNGENHLEIDLSKFVTYTDADGDKIDLGTGTLVLDVKDDAPVASGATVTGTVEEEHKYEQSGDMLHGNEDNDDANGLDNDTTINIIGFPVRVVSITTNIDSGDLKTLVTTGSDEGGAFSLTTNISGRVMTAGENPVVVKSKGQDVQFAFSGGQIVGFVDVDNSGTYNTGDRQVFTLTANANGGFTFTLLDQVDHTFGDNIEDILTLNLGPAVTYTDKDGDVVTLTSGLNIRVIDDTPIADINLNSNKYLTLDETLAGTPSAVGDANANDEVGAADSPLAGATVIGYATDSGAGSLFSNVSKVGADEGMTSTYALKIGNNGVSGLFDAGTNAAITLELGTGALAGMVVGKYGSGANDIAFVVKIDPQTGATSVWQYRAVEHNNDGASVDDSVSLANGSLKIEATVSDYDGDTSTDTVDLGGRIQFQDDASVITNVETVKIAMNWPAEVSATGDIEVAYGSDDAAATKPLMISGWPTIPGVTTQLSSDGLTLTGSYNNQLLYTLKLNATTREYEFKLHQEWPDTSSQTISVLSSDFTDKTSNGTYSYANGAVTFVGINPYGAGFGVGNGLSANAISNGESFDMAFAQAMDSVQLNLAVDADDPGLYGFGAYNGSVTVNWTAYNEQNVAIATGSQTFNNDGSQTISIGNSAPPFVKIHVDVTTTTPSAFVPKMQVTGLTGVTAPIAADDQNLTFQVTATDGDGDKSNKPLIVHLEAVPEVTVTGAIVSEAGLPTRPGEQAGSAEAADGNGADNDVTTEQAAGTITVASTDGLKEVQFTNEAGETTTLTKAQLSSSNGSPVTVFDDSTGKLEITGYNAATGVINYRYTLEDNVDHRVDGAGDQKFVVVAVDPDNFASSPVTVTVTIADDAPIACVDTATVNEQLASAPNNLILAFDVSGSMDEDADGNNFGSRDTRLDVAKQAALNLINASNPAMILIVTFAGSATAQNWMTKQQALDYINGNSFPEASGGTNYLSPIAAIKDAANPPPSGNTSLYFFSDGSVDDKVDLKEGRTAWENYLDANKIKSYAIGVGFDVSAGDQDLNDVQYPGTPIVITKADDGALLATLPAAPAAPNSANGNVLSNDDQGADGARIQSITIGTVTYAWNGFDPITASGVASWSQSGTEIVVATPKGGTLTFNFSTGAWSYVAPADILSNEQESFGYSLIDGDGSVANANLQISITALNDAPVNTVPGGLSVGEDQELSFTGRGLSISDVDANGEDLTVTLKVDNGTLQVSPVNGLQVKDNGESTVILTGSVAEINSALDSLKYVAKPNYFGADELKIITSDNGNNGAGGAKTDVDIVNIEVTSINDPAKIDGDKSKSITEKTSWNDVSSTVSGDLDAYDVDNQNDRWNAVSTPARSAEGYGTFTINSYGEWTYRLDNDNTDVNALKSGQKLIDTFTVTTIDGTAQVVTVTINGANDSPEASDDRVITNAGSAPVLVPEWALLWNDQDVDSPVLDVDQLYWPDGVSASLSTNPGNVTLTDGSSNGGSVDYRASDGSQTDWATVTLVQDSSGSLDGNSGSEILIAGSNATAQRTSLTFASGGYDVGDVVSITFNNVVFSHIVKAGKTSAEDVYDGLRGASAGGKTLAQSLAEAGVTAPLSLTTSSVVWTGTAGVGNAFTVTTAINNGPNWTYTVDFDDVISNFSSGSSENITIKINNNTEYVNSPSGGSGQSAHENRFDAAGASLVTKILGIPGVVAASYDQQFNTFRITTSAEATITGTSTSSDTTATVSLNKLQSAPLVTPLQSASSGGTTINAAGGHDILIGNIGSDILNGGEGNDVLAGGAGKDTLSGGAGTDIYRWGGEPLTAANADTITDYATGERIDVSSLLGNVALAGYVKVVIIGNDLSVRIDTNGGGNSYVEAYKLIGAATSGVTAVNIYYNGMDHSITASSWLTGSDPIILDLDKNDFAFSSIDNGVTFDINADGHKDQIAWTSDDGILAYDVDGNGLIDNGSEIFTPDFNGGKFASGVAALASLDGNGDGKVDAGDDAFKDLKIWIDANNNGVSDEGELSSLSDHGVASISLTTDQTGGEEDGQAIFAEGEFTFEDGSTGNFVEVGFDTIFGSEPEGLTLHGGLGEVVMTGSAGADTFFFDGTALDDLDVADVITDFSSEEGDALDVTALLDSLLGEPADEATAASHLRATVDEHGNTTVSVQTDANDWKDVVVLQNHEAAIKVLFDDKHVTVTPHD